MALLIWNLVTGKWKAKARCTLRICPPLDISARRADWTIEVLGQLASVAVLLVLQFLILELRAELRAESMQ